MDWINPERDIIELIYLITAGPLLLAVACFGLRQLYFARNQLKFSKESAIIINKREAFKLAAEQCNILVEKIFPQLRDYKINIKDQPFYKHIKIIENLYADDVQVIFEKPYSEKEKDNILKKLGEYDVNVIANAIDGFSMYFTNGIASEQMAFNTLGIAYCTAVKQILPTIQSAINQGAFVNLNELYNSWTEKLNTMSLIEQKQKLEAELANRSINNIKSLGVDL